MALSPLPSGPRSSPLLWGSATASAGARVFKVAATGQGPGFSALSFRVDCAQVCERVELRIWAAGAPRFAGSLDFPLRRTPTPRSGPLENYRWPESSSATEAAVESFSAAARKRDLAPGVAPRRAQNGNFVLCRPGPAVASCPAPRALPLLRPADWKRPRRRPGWERGPAAPGGLRVELGCKLSGRREGGGPRPELGGPCAGRLPLGLACLSFQLGGLGMRVINHRKRGVSGPSLPASSLGFSAAAGGSLSGRPHLCCFSFHKSLIFRSAQSPHESQIPHSFRPCKHYCHGRTAKSSGFWR